MAFPLGNFQGLAHICPFKFSCRLSVRSDVSLGRGNSGASGAPHDVLSHVGRNPGRGSGLPGSAAKTQKTVTPTLSNGDMGYCRVKVALQEIYNGKACPHARACVHVSSLPKLPLKAVKRNLHESGLSEHMCWPLISCNLAHLAVLW